MNPGAMVRVIRLMEGVVYHKFAWTYLGFSGGSVVYDSQKEFIPDSIVFLHRLEMN